MALPKEEILRQQHEEEARQKADDTAKNTPKLPPQLPTESAQEATARIRAEITKVEAEHELEAKKLSYLTAAEYDKELKQLKLDQAAVKATADANRDTTVYLAERAEQLDEREQELTTKLAESAGIETTIEAQRVEVAKLNSHYQLYVSQFKELLNAIDERRGYHYNLAMADSWGKFWHDVSNMLNGSY